MGFTVSADCSVVAVFADDHLRHLNRLQASKNRHVRLAGRFHVQKNKTKDLEYPFETWLVHRLIRGILIDVRLKQTEIERIYAKQSLCVMIV